MTSSATSGKSAASLLHAVGVVLVLSSPVLAQTQGGSPAPIGSDGAVEASPNGERAPAAPDRPASVSGGSDLRSGDEADARSNLQAPVAEPLTRNGRDASSTFDRSLAPDKPAAEAESGETRGDGQSATTVEPGGIGRFDLFDGPTTLPAQRENLPSRSTRSGRARPAGSAADPLMTERNEEQDDPSAAADTRELRPSLDPETVDPRENNRRIKAVQQPDLFRPAGPVRSPTFDDLDNDRLDGDLGLGGIRSSLPISPDDPFAPVGIRAGRFTLYPTLDQSFGVSDNLSADPGGEGGAFSQTGVTARLLSDWSRHEAEINAAAVYRRNFNGEPKDEPQVDLDARLRFDIDRDLSATLRGAFAYSRDNESGGEGNEANGEDSDVFAYSVGGELRRDVGRSSLSATVEAVREDRDGGSVAQGDLDGSIVEEEPGESFSTYTAGLRAGYAFGPLLQPFVAGSVGRRVFDDDVDGAGHDRASLIEALRGGLAFDLGEKLYGEVAFGYAWNVPDSGALPTTDSPTVDAALNWSPRRGTDVALTASTFFDPDDSNLSTATRYRAGLAVRHRAWARLDLLGEVFADYRDSDIRQERETTTAVQGGFTYWLNRQLALTSLVRHERLHSEAPDGDYTANSLRLGVRLQR